MKNSSKLLLTALVAATLSLTACDKAPAPVEKAQVEAPKATENSAQVPETFPTQAQLAQKYIQDFDPTNAYLNYYVSNNYEAFNNSLPTAARYDFNPVLDFLSKYAADVLEVANDSNQTDKFRYLSNYVLLKTNEEFEYLVNKYKEDPSKYVIHNNKEFDLDQAYLPVFLTQLNESCAENNYYSVDVAKIKEEIVLKLKDNKTQKLGEDQENLLNNWNNNFYDTCQVADILTSITNVEGFNFDNVRNYVEKVRAESANAQKEEEQQPESEDSKK